MKTVSIGIQARSTSKRFPRKIHELIGDYTALEHVVNNVRISAGYLNAHSYRSGFQVLICLLIPFGDEAKGKINIDTIEGDEDDVLSRYVAMAKRHDSDYIVRITGDCPLIPPPVITAHINKCVRNGLDYLSNTLEPRLSVDGHDCEIFSRSLLNWLDFNSESREHVTTDVTKCNWAKIGQVVGYIDLSHIKLSLDTKEDLENIRKQYFKLQEALIYENTHRF